MRHLREVEAAAERSAYLRPTPRRRSRNSRRSRRELQPRASSGSTPTSSRAPAPTWLPRPRSRRPLPGPRKKRGLVARRLEEQAPPATPESIQFESVTVNYGLTLKLGDGKSFEFVRLDCSMTAKGPDADATYAAVLREGQGERQRRDRTTPERCSRGPDPQSRRWQVSIKILIIGPQGSGKSTMAHEILAALKMGNTAHTARFGLHLERRRRSQHQRNVPRRSSFGKQPQPK